MSGHVSVRPAETLHVEGRVEGVFPVGVPSLDPLFQYRIYTGTFYRLQVRVRW